MVVRDRQVIDTFGVLGLASRNYSQRFVASVGVGEAQPVPDLVEGDAMIPRLDHIMIGS